MLGFKVKSEMKNYFVLLSCMIFLTMSLHAQTVSDIEGNTYNTVSIGSQTWMQENLRSSRFSNGDAIATTTSTINNDSTSVYQWAYNFDTTNIITYGRLYSWYAVMDARNVCPVDWHVSSDAEWLVLNDYLGGDTLAGGKMKEQGTAHWLSTNSSVTNSSGFTGLGAGSGNSIAFQNLGTNAFFWSSTQFGFDVIFRRGICYHLSSANNTLTQTVSLGSNGGSVRCVEDLPAQTGSLFHHDNVRIFPNPTREVLMISLIDEENFTASVYDLSGNLVFVRSVCGPMNRVDISSLARGVYILKLVGPNLNAVKKLIKE